MSAANILSTVDWLGGAARVRARAAL